ncbi:hypothetical protein HIM_10392 [Hirsutella minnesotensis 3608]|uniref:G domain-containing protein n=1 Tax=Hirsutella minnesotensis 3608 TaxID=1043627 RepID=A0A0F7ZG36_9HYPO|nr:hypothetical protein HIM_10392 [Hirsutella minnesotensis 3608]
MVRTTTLGDEPSGPPSYDDGFGLGSQLQAGASGSSETNYLPNETSTDATNAKPRPILKPDDTVVAVMGITGAGKTTFISHFAPEARVGHTLESCTSEVEIHEIAVGQRKIYLIDTPGFDDTHRSDTDILREVANWLNTAYNNSIKLAGIIYLHRIVDNRMSGSAMRNLRMFKRLCGDNALCCVVLATTMWNQVSPEDGAKREHELSTRAEFWAGMVSKGSEVMRQDNGTISAQQILQYILSQRRRINLDIQREMASGKTLDETAAGREVQADMEAIKRKYEEEMADLREEMEEARRAHDVRAQEEIAAMRAEMEEKLRKDREDRERMRVDMEELRAQRSEELARERENAHERELQWLKEMHAAEAQYEAEKARNQSNAALMELQLQLAVKNADNARLEREAAERKQKAEESCWVM